MLSGMDALYHYCPYETFLKIIKNRSIRLSSLSLSNDSMEGKVVAELITDWASRAIPDDSDRQEFVEAIKHLNDLYDGLGFCLSEDGDLLSQWRGYADDGRGVSIGFSKKCLELFASKHLGETYPRLKLKKVIYDPGEQRKLLDPTCIEMQKLIEEGAVKGTLVWAGGVNPRGPYDDPQMELVGKMLSLIHILFLPKHSSFYEEMEWRLIAPYFKKNEDIKICFRNGNMGATPYIDLTLPHSDENPILRVILGPKNPIAKQEVESVLKANGFANATVKGSISSYR